MYSFKDRGVWLYGKMDCSEDWLIDLLVGYERKRETHNGSKRFGLRKGKNNNNKTKKND